MRRLVPLVFLFVLAGCTTLLIAMSLDERHGPADPARFDRASPPVVAAPDYWKVVRPILDQRCVACHACHDSPCQLNLSSYAGLTRGASAMPVYSSARLLADAPTRLGFDAASNAEWRNKGFFPVLNERSNTPAANREGGVMYRLLAAKQADGGTDSADIDLSLARSETCPTAEGVDTYLNLHPQRGMPFALPPLAPAEHAALSRWLEAGAPYSPAPAAPAAVRVEQAEWERFLNDDSKRSQLMARYVFEHWFIGQFDFAAAPGHYFELVRSKTPPGKAIEIIATRRPYDDPGVSRVYYRLRPIEATQVAKNFMPLRLDTARMDRLRKWFLDPAIRVAALPGYAAEDASNPFKTFHDLPVAARYRFLLEDARFVMMGFMKGAVCRGQVALNVINDHFWVVFLSPESNAALIDNDILFAHAPNLQLPAAEESTARILAWRDYAERETRHLQQRSRYLKTQRPDWQPSVAQLWTGEGRNPDAGLTVFRHFDSASVVPGLVGQRPQTALLLGYPLFERMHYLLVAGFDVYGNVGHQLATRLYMDFLRMEGEMNFLGLLPLDTRQKVLAQWYRGRPVLHNEHLANATLFLPHESAVRYHSKDKLGELYGLLKNHLAALPAADDAGLSDAEKLQLQRLSAIQGQTASRLPEFSLLLLEQEDGSLRLASLLRNSAHSNVAQLFREESRRLPEEDTLLALPGVAAAYPNVLFHIGPGELPGFVAAVNADAGTLLKRYGIARNDPRFWSYSDRLHAEWRRSAPAAAAVLDYSRLDNY